MPKPLQAPRLCPVCGEVLALTRLSCDECGTEISGHFPTCEFCSLTQEDRETLKVFLKSRGNMKDLERHLAVSYPTARARFDSLLHKLGFEAPPEDPELAEAKEGRLSVLEELSQGDIDVEEALRKLT